MKNKNEMEKAKSTMGPARELNMDELQEASGGERRIYDLGPEHSGSYRYKVYEDNRVIGQTRYRRDADKMVNS